MDDPSKTNTARELARIEAEAKAAALSEEKRTAEELGRLQAQAYKDQLGEDRGAFMDEFAAVFAGGAKAAFDGDLEEFLIERLRQASYQGLYDAFQALGGSLFDGLGGSKGGGFLGSVLGVFGFGGKRAAGAAVACVIGGGYDRDIEALAWRHSQLHRAALDVWREAHGQPALFGPPA